MKAKMRTHYKMHRILRLHTSYIWYLNGVISVLWKVQQVLEINTENERLMIERLIRRMKRAWKLR